jgi:Bacterial Ig-like domain (group 2)
MATSGSGWRAGGVFSLGLRVLLLVAALVLGAACSHGATPQEEGPGRLTHELNTTSGTLVSIAVTPPTPSVPALATQQFVATGTYSNNTTQTLTSEVNWTVSNPAVATVDTGLVTPLLAGTTTVTATDPVTGIAGTASLTVTTATLVSVAVTPTSKHIPIGTSQNFTATGTFSDGTKFALDSSAVTWTTTNAAIATVASAGGATGVSEGTVAVIATNPATGLSGQAILIVGTETLVSVAVTPATQSIPKGQTQSFVATGTYSDDTTLDLTDLATWSSSSNAIAKVSNVAGSNGVATAAGVGTATITAKIAGVSGTASLTVTAALLESIAVTPATTSLPNGTTQQLTATGTYSDGTTKNITKTVTWTSALPDIVSVSNATGSIGLASALSLGVATVIATDPTTLISSGATLTVTAAVLKSLAVTPATASVPLGLQKSYTATGTFTDLTTQNMTATVLWTSSAPAIATISNAAGSAGVATTATVGTTSVTAFDPVSGINSKAATLKVRRPVCITAPSVRSELHSSTHRGTCAA